MYDINKGKLSEASVILTRHLGMEVIASTYHGSKLRGFNDPNSDIDICFLLNRPVSDYINMTNVPFFEGTIEDRRKKLSELSNKMARELGWPIMVALLDMRSMLRGIMNSSTFSLMAYECFAKENERVRFLFEPVVKDYFSVENLVFRCGEHVTSAIRAYSQIPEYGMEYKQERTFLGTLWSTHRMLAYLGGDTQHCRTVTELIEYNRKTWSEEFPEGFHRSVVGVIRLRTERSPFESPRGVSAEASSFLLKFADDVLQKATSHLREHPKRYPTLIEETREMIDLYQCLLDESEKSETKTAIIA